MVYESLLSRQSDYIYFIYGISLFLLALAGLSSGRLDGQRMHWGWLVLFAAVHGSYELLEMTTYVVGDNRPFAVFRSTMFAASFICLLEFGRAGTFGVKGRLIYPLLVALSLIGVRWGLVGLNTYTGYFLGVPAGLWACAAFFRASGTENTGNLSLKAAGAGIALYALAEGFLAPHNLILDSFGIPAQLVKLVLVLSVTIALLFFCRAQEKAGEVGGTLTSQQRYYHPIMMVSAILAVGWLVTEAVGRHLEDEASSNLLSRTLTASASLLPDHVGALTGTPADEGRPEFEHLRTDLVRIKAVNPDCRFVYLMGMRGGKEIFLVDAEPKGSKDYSTPGDIYPDATPEELADFIKGKPKVYKPYTDSWGTWVSGIAFIANPASGEEAALFGMDIDARKWMHTVTLSRFFCIIITFGISMLSIVLYIAWHRGREAAEQGAALRLATQKLINEKKLKDLVNSLGEGVIVQDAKGLVSFVNPETERLLGWTADELTGRPVAEALGWGEDGGGSDPLSSRTARRTEEGYFNRKDGSRIAVMFVTSPILEGDKVTGAVIGFQDITERKDIERQKSDFYAMVSHDLKSPLAAIQGFSELLLQDPSITQDAESEIMLKNIHKGSKKVLVLVNDFLTVSRADSGRLTLNEILVDIGGMVNEAAEELKPAAGKKGISLSVDLPEGLPRVVCDRMHLARAVTNLLGNAVNYTPDGGAVSVKVEKAVADGKDFIRVKVSDTGPGVPPEESERIFEKYYRSSRTSGLKGSGLGLAIVKAVVAAHGGKVEFESAEGEGCTFSILVPIKGY